MPRLLRRHLLLLFASSWLTLLALPSSGVGLLSADDDEAPQTAAAETTLLDFDDALPDDLQATGCEVEHLTADGQPAAGAGALRMSLGAKFGYVQMPMPDGVNFATAHRLSVSLRLRSDEALGIRWIAFNEAGKGIWQRRDELPVETTDGEWHRHEFELASFRWGNRHVADWSAVRELALVIFERDEPITVDLDELALVAGNRGAASAWHTEQWLRRVAFGERPAQFARRGRILVGIDVPADEGVTAAELGDLADRLAPLSAWVKRLFGDAVRPVGGDRPVPMLIFRNEGAYRRFFVRLGDDWNVNIAPPGAGGYAVQDIATSSFDREQGLGRPVYIHETMHAVVARDLRLIPGNAYHSWLQEGLANYLQLSLYPDALPREVMARQFRQRPRRDGRGFFKPISDLLTHRVGLDNYAQLASLLAFMEAEHADWLPTIARLVADGEPVDRVFAAVDSDFVKVEAEWFAWGQKLYAADPPAGPGPHFARPPEWPHATGDDGDGKSDD